MRKTHVLIATAAALFAFLSDFWSKNFWFGLGERKLGAIPVWLLRFTEHQNRGLIGDIPLFQPAIIIFTIFVLMVFIWFIFHSQDHSRCWFIALGCIIGGATGNLYDRLMFGYVRDWIVGWNWSAFNVADIWIILGALMVIRCSQKEEKEKRKKDA